MKITVLYDNSHTEGLKSGWGLSLLVEDGKSLLFDCGDNGRSLTYNMDRLGVDPASIDYIVLSHDHWDHTGGIADVLERAKDPVVAVPISFNDDTKDAIRGRGRLLEISGPQRITGNVYTTGELESPQGPNEQSLLIKTGEGIFILTGCSHPGLGPILSSARRLGKVRGILGGFHGFSETGLLKGVKSVFPCHCTQHADQIRRAFPGSCRKARTGSVIEI